MNVDDIRKRLDTVLKRDPKLAVKTLDNGVVIQGAAEDGSLLIQYLVDFEWAIEAIEALLAEMNDAKT